MANRRITKKKNKALQKAIKIKEIGKVEEENMKSRFFVQYQGNEFEEKEIITKIKEIWKEEGNKVKDLKELDIYVKPEEGKAYYTINGETRGSIDIF
ncbi:DUF6465 family protein [Anaerostipes sp.]|uniref:DUF6465 family protein n=1 Tax=Anaerostipes sp. TaxID=1872530 RepID=UPI0025859D79|nr:DUF6465 family protein [Anaerostipes sp.]MCI5623160.1 DUF6465 family protein [Anaerostipes sp.]